MSLRARLALVPLVGALALTCAPAPAKDSPPPASLDEQVEAFLAARESTWQDMNVPMRDGQFLYDMIVEHGYTRALEIGTSTGHSSIWIAWALSKTGGRLVTLEIDEARHREALWRAVAEGLVDVIGSDHAPHTTEEKAKAEYQDIAARRVYLFGSTFNAQDVWLLFFLLSGVGFL